MTTFRSGRLEENRQKRRLTVAVVGSVGVILFFALFGVKILVGFSLLVDKLRGTSPASLSIQNLLLPPILDPILSATKSATLTVSGRATENARVIIYVNEEEEKKISVEKDGTFASNLTTLREGINIISARTLDDKDNTSDLSNVLTVLIKKTPPILELSSSEDGASVTGDTNKVTVAGKTEENTSVTINGRVVVVRSDNTFSYDYPLNEGENKLTVAATDTAGNTTSIERTITYHR